MRRQNDVTQEKNLFQCLAHSKDSVSTSFPVMISPLQTSITKSPPGNRVGAQDKSPPFSSTREFPSPPASKLLGLSKSMARVMGWVLWGALSPSQPAKLPGQFSSTTLTNCPLESDLEWDLELWPHIILPRCHRVHKGLDHGIVHCPLSCKWRSFQYFSFKTINLWI